MTPLLPLLGWAVLASRPPPASRLQVTEGALRPLPGDRAEVTEPKVRAVAPGSSGEAAELAFVYRGPTERRAALRSGAQRVQLGLKLRAEDPCNLVYVMWRIEPGPALVVSLKHNPGEHRSAACENNGYTNVRAQRSGLVPAVEVGSRHVMHARLAGAQLRVWADGALVWEGTLPAEAQRLHGPAGLRTDNVHAELQLSTDPND